MRSNVSVHVDTTAHFTTFSLPWRYKSEQRLNIEGDFPMIYLQVKHWRTPPRVDTYDLRRHYVLPSEFIIICRRRRHQRRQPRSPIRAPVVMTNASVAGIESGRVGLYTCRGIVQDYDSEQSENQLYTSVQKNAPQRPFIKFLSMGNTKECD